MEFPLSTVTVVARSLHEFGVGVEYLQCTPAGIVEYLAVGGEVGYVEGEGESALLGTLHVAGSAELHVGFRDQEAVGGLGHDVEPLTCVGADLLLGHEHAVTAV